MKNNEFSKIIEKNKNIMPKINIISILVLIAICLLSVGYSIMAPINLKITGKLAATTNDGIFITNVTGGNEDTSYYKTLLTSTTELTKGDSSSTVTYTITILNNTNDTVKYYDAIYGTDFYENPDITFELSGLKQGDTLLPYQSVTFDVTFKYADGVSTDNNILKSSIDFQFKKFYTIAYENLNTTSLPTIGFYDVPLQMDLTGKAVNELVILQEANQLDYNYENEKLTVDNIKNNIKIVNLPKEKTTNFTYTGGEQTFKALVSGKYKLEVWGAQGGTANSYRGGYGGYSYGIVNIDVNKELNVVIGGKGVGGKFDTVLPGGYNGGAPTIYSGDNNHNRQTASGGGATHIAKVTGELKNLSSKIDDILIVAGGGGGGYQHLTTNGYYGEGGSGGGYIGATGKSGAKGSAAGTGGSQTTAGHANGDSSIGSGGFGYGGTVGSKAHGASGGGGFYGGGGSSGKVLENGNSAGGGGSGYIGNSLLKDKGMYGYNVSTSEDIDTKTTSTTNVSETPTSNYAKIGDGYARITLISVY